MRTNIAFGKDLKFIIGDILHCKKPTFKFHRCKNQSRLDHHIIYFVNADKLQPPRLHKKSAKIHIITLRVLLMFSFASLLRLQRKSASKIFMQISENHKKSVLSASIPPFAQQKSDLIGHKTAHDTAARFYCSICLARKPAAVSASLTSISPSFTPGSLLTIITAPMGSP